MSDQQAVDSGQQTHQENAQESQEAVRMGWNPNLGVDAAEYMKIIKSAAPLIKASNQVLLEEIRKRDAHIEELKGNLGGIKKGEDERELRAYDRATEEFEAEKVQALQEGNHARVIEIDRALRKLEEGKKEKQAEIEKGKPAAVSTQQVQQMTPEAQRDLNSWLADNPAIAKDATLQRATGLYAEDVRRELPMLQGRPFLDELARRLKVDYPHKFEGQSRTSPVDGGGGNRAGSTRKRTAADLPSEARQAAQFLISKGVIKDEAEYIKNYFRE